MNRRADNCQINSKETIIKNQQNHKGFVKRFMKQTSDNLK